MRISPNISAAGTISQYPSAPILTIPFIYVSGVYAAGYNVSALRFSPGEIVSREWHKGTYAGAERYDGPSGITSSEEFFYYEGFFEYRSLSHFDETRHTDIETPIPSATQNLCFKIHSPGMLGAVYESNEVQIPAEALISALKSQGDMR